MTSVRRGTVGRNINTCHATRGFLAAVGPYPRPDYGEGQIPGGWAVQLESVDHNTTVDLGTGKPCP